MYNFKKYIVEDGAYGDQFPFTMYETKKIYEQDQNGQIKQKDLVLVSIKNTQTNFDIIEKLRKLKYISIIQPLDFEYTEQYLKLYYPDILKYQFNIEQLKKFKDTDVWKFLLQLVLTYREFDRRNIQWPLIMLEQIYYINGQFYLCLNQYLFNYENTTNTVSIKAFIEQNFAQDNNLMKIIQQSKDVLFDLEEYLLRMCQVDVINWLYPPYEQVLANILNILNFKNLVNQGNSVIKSFPTSDTLKQVYRKDISDELIVKSTRYQSKDFEDQIEQNIDRELQHLETSSQVNYLANCYFYFRIRKYSFLIMKKYAGTVRDILNNWPDKQSTKEQIRKQIYFFAQRFAQALLEMHSLKILHRDLKPENLFVDNLNFTEGNIYIADFDRSKQLQDFYNFQITSANCYNTQIYDPPENPQDNQSLAYDIFQYGLILLEVSNLGKYFGQPCGPRHMDQQVYNQIYSEENIKNTLNKHLQFSPQFIELISQCLKRDQLERPNAEELYQKINKIYLNSKIVIIQR